MPAPRRSAPARWSRRPPGSSAPGSSTRSGSRPCAATATRGAFELAATVDYFFGYDATTGVVADWMYDKLTET
ncbi:cobaltochelatase subunit CobN [Streptomyces pseudogriseolus]|uniref:cobaltochelatase subunit CobN n=1 Tax=Streptomyces pseudogriseolus TaxID=36817 RepID=UPI003FA24B7A